ncbi:MAG TPA: DUF58 domain-containing protein [Candidatus Nanopelagicales bacterium]|nr:DUF58 domain-containing protein [Candidatus Nanopelagicales bacterium]
MTRQGDQEKPRQKPLPAELLKQLRRIEIRTQRLATQEMSGSYHSVFKGQGLSFREVRAYNPGDDVRWIDWNVSARMSEPFVKVFVEEREMTVMLVVDASQSEQFGTRRASKAQIAAEICALCAFSAIKNSDRVGLVLATDAIELIVPPKKGDKHVLRVVREILGHEPQYTGTNLKLALETLVKVAKRRSVAFVVSDFFASGFERALALAAAKHDVIPVMLVDPRDEELPDVGLAAFEDLETGEEVLVDTGDPAVREHYKKAMRKLRGDRDRLFKKLALDAVVVKMDQGYVGPMRELFARRARRIRR